MYFAPSDAPNFKKYFEDLPCIIKFMQIIFITKLWVNPKGELPDIILSHPKGHRCLVMCVFVYPCLHEL